MQQVTIDRGICTRDDPGAGLDRCPPDTRTGVDGEITLQVDGAPQPLTVDTRTTLLDALRERLGVTSPKKAATTGSAARARCWSTADGC
jgi:hypothetical protein